MGLIKSANAPPTLAPFSMRDVEAHARAMLLRAKDQSEQLLVAAQSEAEDLKKQAYEQGLAEGRAQGQREGIEAGKKVGHAAAQAEHAAKLKELTAALVNVLTELDARRRELETGGLAEVVELAAAIARRVTKRQSAVDPQVMIANLRDAMGLVVRAADVRVAVHPAQRQALLDELPSLQTKWPQLKHVELIDDPALSLGGCRVHAGHGHIDADIEAQLDRVIGELLPDSEGTPRA